MNSIGSFETRVTSQISGPSRLEIIGKYFLHGVVFGIAYNLISFGIFFLTPLEYLFGIVGAIIMGVVMLIALPWANADICSWLWYFDVQRYWPRLFAHGILLSCILLTMGLKALR